MKFFKVPKENKDQSVPILGVGKARPSTPAWASEVALLVQNPPTNTRDRRLRSDPWVRKCPGVGNGNSLHYSFRGNPRGGAAWRAAVHGVTKSWTQLSTHSYTQHTCKRQTLRKQLLHRNTTNYIRRQVTC